VNEEDDDLYYYIVWHCLKNVSWSNHVTADLKSTVPFDMDGNTISYNGAGTHDMYYYSQSMETLNTEKKKTL